MKFGKIYADATGRMSADVSNEIPVSPAATELKTQLKVEWLSSAVTGEMFKKLNDEKDELLNAAIVQAVAFSETQNHMRIINSLVRVDQINKILNTYAHV